MHTGKNADICHCFTPHNIFPVFIYFLAKNNILNSYTVIAWQKDKKDTVNLQQIYCETAVYWQWLKKSIFKEKKWIKEMQNYQNICIYIILCII